MTRIAVLGNNGMLGWMMQLQLSQWDNYDVVGFNRSDFEIIPYINPKIALKRLHLNEYDFIINCIGVIKPMFSNKLKIPEYVFVNSIFPWSLASFGEEHSSKVIHITSDCCFSGNDGLYTEESKHDPLDEYGKSKSLGEPTNCMVIRTSIIGPEIRGRKRSLVENVKVNSINIHKMFGYTNHWWNGLTTKELSILVGDIIERDLYSPELFHLYSDDVSKFYMIESMISTWGLNIELEQKETAEPCNRTLRTIKNLNNELDPKGFDDMIEDLSAYV